jgi:hypothetical protein
VEWEMGEVELLFYEFKTINLVTSVALKIILEAHKGKHNLTSVYTV